MNDYVVQIVRFLDKLKDLPILFFRIILAIGFYPAAVNKYRDPGWVRHLLCGS